VTRLINTVLITVFAFFAFLGVFWHFQGGGTGAGPRGEPTVTAITPQWGDGAKALTVDLAVHNPGGDPAVASTVTYDAVVDGKTVDHAVARPLPVPVPTVPAKGDGPVPFNVTLPKDFAVTWWTGYMRDAESTELRIHGSVSMRRSDGPHEVPFEWRSSWTGSLAKGLTQAVNNCDQQPTDLCLSQGQFTWVDGTLHATLTLHNPGPDAVAIGNATLKLSFGDHAVVGGRVDLLRTLPPSSDTSVPLVLTFSQSAIAAWWPDHVAACERTPVTFGLDLQAQPVKDSMTDNGVTTEQWTFPAAPLQTRFVCGQ
jgi:LEA14-like dessication related protein